MIMFKQKISEEVWGGESGKYRLRDADGNPIDQTPEDTCMRVASALAEVEPKDKEYWRDEFFRILAAGKASGGGRIMANAGAFNHKKNTSAINCVVLRQIPDSMEGIMETAKDAAITLKAGCGVGYDFSTIRPKGAYVYGAGAETSGVISFMKIFDAICSTVMSGGGRRGAQMGCLNIQHPEVETFISCKRQDGLLRYFNLSVLITDDFMEAVEKDLEWNLWFWEKTNETPDKNDIKVIKKDDVPFYHPEFNYFSYSSEHTEVKFKNCTEKDIFKKKIFKTMKARDLFDKIMKSNYDFAEPGFLLIDRINKENNLWFDEIMSATNPCFHEDTLIALADGRGYKTIKELAEEGRDVPVYSIDANGDVSIKIGRNPRITGYGQKLLEIGLSDGSYLRVTPNHKMLLKTGESKEAKDLVVGDSLPRFYSDLFEVDGASKKYYRRVNNSVNGNIYNNLEFEHRIIARYHNKDTWDKLYDENKKSGSKYRKAENIEYWKRCEQETDLETLWMNDRLYVVRYCEHCGGKMVRDWDKREVSFCSPQCSTNGTLEKAQATRMPNVIKEQKKMLHDQIMVYKDLEDSLGREPMYKEWIDACKNKNISYRIRGGKKGKEAKKLNPYLLTSFNELREISEGYNHRVTYVKELDGEHTVYNITVDDNHTLAVITNLEKSDEVNGEFKLSGIYTAQCGEQCLPPNQVCLLGSMILPPYVINPFNNASFDWDSFRKDIRTFSRFLDNVVEINNLPISFLDEGIRYKRRHGLGFTGLGTIFNMMGMKYGSKESIDLADKIALTIAQESLITNIELAKEKGPAPIFQAEENRRLVMESGYMKRLIPTFKNADQIRAQIMEYGLRYSHATSIAPTGTMSLTWGNNCSNGIEPSFSNSYMRNVRIPGKKTKVQEEVFSYEYLLWKELYGDKELPSYWSTTDNLSVDDHINIQSAVQKWVDSAVSKTANVPTDYPFEDFKEIYIKGWKAGLKGVTTFRFNPEAFSGVLVRKEDLLETKYTFTLEDGTEVEVSGADQIEYDGEIHNAANLFDALKEGMYGDM